MIMILTSVHLIGDNSESHKPFMMADLSAQQIS